MRVLQGVMWLLQKLTEWHKCHESHRSKISTTNETTVRGKETVKTQQKHVKYLEKSNSLMDSVQELSVSETNIN